MVYTSEEEVRKWEQFTQEYEYYLMGFKTFPTPSPEEIYRRGFKLAIVKGESGPTTVYQHDQTREQCKFFEDGKHFDIQKGEIYYIKPTLPFIRWARPMDI